MQSLSSITGYVERRNIPSAQIRTSMIDKNANRPAMEIGLFDNDIAKSSNYGEVIDINILFKELKRLYGEAKARYLIGNYGTQAMLYLPNGGLSGLEPLPIPEPEPRPKGVIGDVGTLVLIGLAIWFLFPVLQRLRPVVAEGIFGKRRS